MFNSRFVGYPEVGQKRRSRRAQREQRSLVLTFPQLDFWTGIASECGIAAVDDKPGCGCVVILPTKLPELSRLAKIVADPNHRKE